MTIGIDRQLTPDIVAGFSFGLQSNRGHGFDDLMQSETNGFSVGPYIAFRLTPHWAINGSFSYSQNKSDLQIVVLNGSSTLRSYTGTMELHGQHTIGEWHFRPKFSVAYAHNVSGERNMQGIFLGAPLTLNFSSSSSDFGIAAAYGEMSRLLELSNGLYMIPYAEFGLQYAFERPNGGQILTGDLSNVVPSAWNGSLRTGVRMQLPNAALVEASIGYLSLGQPDLDVWEGRLRVSLGF